MREEVARIGDVGGNVILGARVEIVLRCAQPVVPPPDTCGVSCHQVSLYFSGGISPENTFQRHWSISSPKGKKATFSNAVFSSSPMSFEVSGAFVQQTQLHQVFRRDRKRDRVADCLVKAIVGAVAEQHRLLVVSALVEVVAQFVVDGVEILRGDVDAHLDP